MSLCRLVSHVAEAVPELTVSLLPPELWDYRIGQHTQAGTDIVNSEQVQDMSIEVSSPGWGKDKASGEGKPKCCQVGRDAGNSSWWRSPPELSCDVVCEESGELLKPWGVRSSGGKGCGE